MPRMLVTGGAGFIGSHAAEHFASRGYDVTVLDNLSRGRLLRKADPNAEFNWTYLRSIPRVRCIRGDIREREVITPLAAEADVIVHAAAQTAVTTSTVDPSTDFETNALGTFRVLEAARQGGRTPTVIYCSTNKVYGENVNSVGVAEEAQRYRFVEEWSHGIPESFSIDRCEHTPYGCSKLTGDLYVQDFGHLYGLRTGVFRMSCIYGTRQFGMEDQGWVAWFVIAALTGRPLTIFGDGKQVRDLLWVEDLVGAWEAFLESDARVEVFNMGGGPEYTLSLLELLERIEAETGIGVTPARADWRPSDQKVYISDIRRARERLGWAPAVSPSQGVARLIAWAQEHQACFQER
ncbi:MAG: NAD-dependent epimerase/dehydratase family protein [Candidatus Eisenbacteria bacterium]|nr:NAD-dependent epimerase/dehydratase family protein [Candidatus Eisenbacteria bacterium]